jgi:large subunit ribosomal protein L4
MIELPVRNREGQVAGQIAIDEALFGGTVRLRVLRDAVIMYEACQRVGTHSTLVRSEVHGSHAKPWRQKGTGRARAGFKRSPLWRGGCRIFGPRPREYRYAMPHKALLVAKKSAFLAKFQDGTIVIDELKAEQPKTREMAGILENLGIERSCLVALEAHDTNLWKSLRNIPRTAMKAVGEINAYDLLRYHTLLITRTALEQLIETMKKSYRPPRQAAEAAGATS